MFIKKVVRKNKMGGTLNFLAKAGFHSQGLSFNQKLSFNDYTFDKFKATESKYTNITKNNLLKTYSSVEIGLALSYITHDLINQMHLKTEEEKNEVFLLVKKLFIEKKLPLVFTAANKVAVNSISESINFVINLKNYTQITSRIKNGEKLSQEEKLNVVQNTINKYAMQRIPASLKGEKGHLKHGLIDQMILAQTKTISILFVMIDSILNGNQDDTESKIKSKVETSINYFFVIGLMVVSLAILNKLLEKSFDNRLEDLNNFASEMEELYEINLFAQQCLELSDEIVEEFKPGYLSYFLGNNLIKKEEVWRLISNIKNKEIEKELTDHFSQVFDNFRDNEINYDNLKNNVKKLNEKYIRQINECNNEFSQVKEKFFHVRNKIKNPDDLINKYRSHKDFVSGYPKHCINNLSHDRLRFFKEKDTRDALSHQKTLDYLDNTTKKLLDADIDHEFELNDRKGASKS